MFFCYIYQIERKFKFRTFFASRVTKHFDILAENKDSILSGGFEIDVLKNSCDEKH